MRKWIQAATVEIDETTGAMLVKLDGQIHADVVQADMDQVTGAVDGAGGKSLKDIDAGVASIVQQQRPSNVSFQDVVISGGPGIILLQAAVPGKVVRLHSLVAIVDADDSLSIIDTSGVNVGGSYNLKARGGLDLYRGLALDAAICKTVAGRGLRISTITGAVHGIAKISVEN